MLLLVLLALLRALALEPALPAVRLLFPLALCGMLLPAVCCRIGKPHARPRQQCALQMQGAASGQQRPGGGWATVERAASCVCMRASSMAFSAGESS